MSRPGVLAIFNDVKRGREADFEAWFQGEHLIERLGVPGFLFGRRHQAISGACGYFNFYLVKTPAVLKSKPYLTRLDTPTPMTRKIMGGGVFQNMNRTVCERTLRLGAFRGAYVVTARFNDATSATRQASLLKRLVKDPAVASGEIWKAASPRGFPVSMEEKLRGGDKKIKGALMIETLRQSGAEDVARRLKREFPRAEVGVFRVLCSLGRGDL
jgi:hypothetical protein